MFSIKMHVVSCRTGTIEGFWCLMHLSAAIPGVDPGDMCGNSAGFADFYR